MKKKPVSKEEVQRRELLRQALDYVLPSGKAEAAVSTLLGRFGGFSGVFLAPQEELAAVLGQPPARFLRLVTDLARAYLEDSSQDLARVYDADSAIALFRPKFLGRSTEAVCLMLLDSRGRLLYNDFIAEGAVSAVHIYIRPLLQLCIRYDAQHVLLAHNHPSGNAAASRNDITATRQVEMALESIEATLNDHIIFAGEDTLSFAQCGWLGQIKEEVRGKSCRPPGNKRLPSCGGTACCKGRPRPATSPWEELSPGDFYWGISPAQGGRIFPKRLTDTGRWCKINPNICS